jgi:DNA (cytosine-5)-methyltransferase 3A
MVSPRESRKTTKVRGGGQTMNVLSLFDGISCGQIALQRVGIEIDNYYASEIDKDAIKITQKHFPRTLQLGDIKGVDGKELPKIDLLIEGSPCQGFSFTGKQLNFNDDRSMLLFEFVRILEEVKPKYFLLENVKMKKEFEEVITKCLKVKPIEINSSDFSAQSRKRLYWTNIPIKNWEDKGIILSDILEDLPFRELKPFCFGSYGGRKRIDALKDINAKKSHTLTTSRSHTNQYYLNGDREEMRFLSLTEAERLQTLPEGYTEGIKDGKRFSLIGNGWTVDVIAHIFKGMVKQ